MGRKQHILLSKAGVALTNALTDTHRVKAVWQCKWEEVREVVAWKDDAYIYDIIRIGFRTSDEPQYLVAHEEADGWDQLILALEYRFGICWSDRYSQVAFPAFRENWTVL